MSSTDGCNDGLIMRSTINHLNIFIIKEGVKLERFLLKNGCHTQSLIRSASQTLQSLVCASRSVTESAVSDCADPLSDQHP